ncbi:bifunctional hydroxymethylpyrimidine kinase/phosphomethylpyrimidine kinase [Hydrogenothermus marinus]|uniref:hydroxymethylpyrimidine kinase n=1 Tax=Hydrogenothermus marinus TaxID=133270 RepID=A0A3M0C2B2_9AQUI|nr:bifunctional hydroxymethylpyrimidine kinase/phosphomethylpyrimidine kinase [Hydrogenothermus marinus]RMA97082.1 hydroxymethylpyrimidine/phosphomethylpyrimidine kinase [Hydrogenothermus marinus]
MKKALTIAGSDNSGGAGVQADLKVFKDFSVFGLSAITSITVQNSQAVYEVIPVSSKVLYNQIKAIAEDTKIDAVKIGMILTKENVNAIYQAIKDFNLKNIVLDTVIKSSSGKYLLEENAIKDFKTKLLPLVDLITPNKLEAEVLTGIKINNLEDLENACIKLHKIGAKNIYLKGGHFDFKNQVIDIFFNGKKFIHLIYPKVKVKNVHGTGCVLSSAITANLANKKSLEKSIKIARAYIQQKIEDSFKFGKGYFYMKL